ncbi:hypothetical protein HDV00_011164 [Rhizophlyctis rosea]|nr:hypothetical protein HDV00_011164 [Rhizophlyctis rosea]
MLSTQPDATKPTIEEQPQSEQHTEQQTQADGQQQESTQQPRPLPGKGPLGRFQTGSFKSPTDNLMSPATQKVEAKRKQHLANIKPKSLADRFAATQKPSDN